MLNVKEKQLNLNQINYDEIRRKIYENLTISLIKNGYYL